MSGKTEYRRWFDSMKDGDAVLVRKPWRDGRIPGGSVHKGHVRINCNGLVVVHFRIGGRRLTDNMHQPCHCYTHLMPTDGRVPYYEPNRGYVLPRKAP